LTNGWAWNAVSAFANCGRAVAHVRGSYGPRLCENSKTLNRDRTSYSFEIVFGAHIASPFDFEIELKNIFSSRFEFLTFRTA
jgi:hypothetical protein